MSYDSACHDLAALFLEAEAHTGDDITNLAQAIQDAIEGWFFEHEDELRNKRGGESKHVVAKPSDRPGE